MDTELKNIRSRYFACILYPENAYHCEYLQFLRESQKGFYIIHDAGSDMYNVPYSGFVPDRFEDSGKAHIHCIMEFKNARRASGIIKSNPYVRYYKNARTEQLFTVYDILYISLPLEEVVQPIVGQFQPIIDIYAYCQYILHKDFKSVSLGKKQYSVSDIQMLNADRTLLDKYYECSELTDKECLEIIRSIWVSSDGDYNTFLSLLSMYSSDKPLKYVQSHAYFIQKFLLRNEVLTND